MDRKFERGKIDILSLLGTAFLVISLGTAVYFTASPQIKQFISSYAGCKVSPDQCGSPAARKAAGGGNTAKNAPYIPPKTNPVKTVGAPSISAVGAVKLGAPSAAGTGSVKVGAPSQGTGNSNTGGSNTSTSGLAGVILGPSTTATGNTNPGGAIGTTKVIVGSQITGTNNKASNVSSPGITGTATVIVGPSKTAVSNTNPGGAIGTTKVIVGPKVVTSPVVNPPLSNPINIVISDITNGITNAVNSTANLFTPNAKTATGTINPPSSLGTSGSNIGQGKSITGVINKPGTTQNQIDLSKIAVGGVKVGTTSNGFFNTIYGIVTSSASPIQKIISSYETTVDTFSPNFLAPFLSDPFNLVTTLENNLAGTSTNTTGSPGTTQKTTSGGSTESTTPTVDYTTPPAGLTVIKGGPGCFTGGYCDGQKMWKLYQWYKSQPNAWWNQQTGGNFTPSDFLAVMLMAETADGSPDALKNVSQAVKNQLWGAGNPSAPDKNQYCATSDCAAGIMNFLAAYSESARRRFDAYVLPGQLSPKNLDAAINDNSTIGDMFAKAGLTIETVANSSTNNSGTTVFTNDAPTQWAFGGWTFSAIKHEPTMGPLPCQLYYYGRGTVVYSFNQEAYWQAGGNGAMKNGQCQ